MSLGVQQTSGFGGITTDQLVLWAEVYTDNSLETRTFVIYATGEEQNEHLLTNYIGTTTAKGWVVCHVYEVLNNREPKMGIAPGK